MKPRILCYILLSVITASGYSQQEGNFSGKVTNVKSAAIPGSTIYLLNTNQGTTADHDGNFSFKDLPAGKYAIQISSVGYATLNRDVVIDNSTTGPVNFSLADAAVQLDGVLVSAQKKEEFLQKVPLSITAISSKQVAAYRLWNSKELTAIVPNFYSANSGDDRNVTSIRGIATTSYDPAVTTYIDGVNQFSLDTYIATLSDIERIEVLRGPQGTLYGRNAMGGVINIITKQPSNKLNGFIELNAGNYDQFRMSAGLRLPLVMNKLFLGISGVYNTRDGFYTNDLNNSSFDKQYSVTKNIYLKYIASNKLAFTVNVKHQNYRNNGAFPLVVGDSMAFNNPFHLEQNATAKMIDNTFNISLIAAYTGKKLNFSSQTAYQSNHRYYDKPLDGDFFSFDGVTIINDYGDEWNKVKVLTQEFKFTSPSATTSKIKWTLGSYLFYQDNPSKQAVHFGKDAAYVGAPDTDFSIINSTKGKSSGIAFFGQLSYAITGKLSVIAGIRYDHEKKRYNVLGEYQKDPDPNPLFETRPDTSASVNFNAFSPKFGLSYNINTHSDAFVTYSRGYRTGGLTALSSDPSQPPLYPYKPEYSNNIETGIKNNLLNNRLQLNVTAFLTYVTDAQVPTLLLPDAVTVTKNAGELTSKGIELELASTPVKGLQVDYNFGYTDATYKNLKLAQNGSAVDLDGKKQIFTPESTSMLAMQYSYGLGTKMKLKLVARAEWIYLGKQYFDLANNIKQNDHSLLNIRFGLSSSYATLMFWAKNLGDKKYIAYAYDFGAIHLGDPRTIGVTLSTGF
ncbi:MAG: TonB-dependent receptor [Ferruginibacter sp.]